MGMTKGVLCRECVYPKFIDGELICTRTGEHIAGIGFCYDGKPTPPTNADHIRAMSDEELATKARALFHGCPPRLKTCPDCPPGCKKCWLNWLKSPKEDGT